MKRNLVLKFVETNENVGCNNGTLDYAIAYVNGKKSGTFGFCRCGNGCNGTDKINAFRHFEFVFPEEEEHE